MRWPTVGAVVIAILLLGTATGCQAPGSDGAPGLQGPSSFATIQDRDARAVALFAEAAKVLTHPRCMNCHPAGESPYQGDRATVHQPRVRRGADGFGAPGMRCQACHHGANFDPGRVPGAPHWHLAPVEMAWEGLSVGEICAQLKDPARNGGRSLADIVTYMAEDPLVAWGWQPGAGRAPAPGTQAVFARLIEAWVDAGAACDPG